MRIKNFEQFLNEKAVSASEVLSGEPNTAVIKVVTKKPTKQYLKLILYNFKDKVIEGYIALEKFASDSEYMIQRAYAIDKHGPLMYELALSVLSPTGIIPDRAIRPGAQKVWDYFDKKRPDVKKTVLGPKHTWFAKEYEVDIEHEHLKNPDILEIINKSYSLDKPMEYTQELIDKGTALLAKNALKPKDIIDKADKAFADRYNSEF
jgi:hypothetical protein